MIGKIIVIALFILLGTMLSLSKWSFLIAGFNTMSKEEKENCDILALCKFMRKFMFMITFCVLLFILSDILMMKILYNIALILVYSSLLFVIIYTNTGNRFKKKNKVVGLSCFFMFHVNNLI